MANKVKWSPKAHKPLKPKLGETLIVNKYLKWLEKQEQIEEDRYLKFLEAQNGSKAGD